MTPKDFDIPDIPDIPGLDDEPGGGSGRPGGGGGRRRGRRWPWLVAGLVLGLRREHADGEPHRECQGSPEPTHVMSIHSQSPVVPVEPRRGLPRRSR